MLSKDKRERLSKLQAQFEKLKNGYYCGQIDKVVKEKINWFTRLYFKMPEFERLEIKQAWDKYYRGEWIDRINKPAGFDPMEWDNADWALNYRRLEKEINTLINEESEFSSEFDERVAANVW